MDWVALITTLITTFLPLIINKGPAMNRFALQRRQVYYAKLADAQAAINPAVSVAAYEASELCCCLADCKTKEEQLQVYSSALDGYGKAKGVIQTAATTVPAQAA